MSFTYAIFNVLSIGHRIVAAPYLADASDYRFIENTSYNALIHQLYRLYFRSTVVSFIVFAFVKIFWPCYHDSSLLSIAILYLLFVCLSIISLTLSYQIHKHSKTCQFIITECCKLDKFTNPWITSNRLHSRLVYTFTAVCMLLPVSCGLTPFAISFDPLQLLFGTSLKVKLVATFFYTLIIAYSAGLLLGEVFFHFLFLEAIRIYSATFAVNGIGAQFLTLRDFNKGFHGYLVVSLLVKTYDEAKQTISVILLCTGIVLASSCIYATIRMFHVLHILTYLACPVMAGFCFATAIVLTYLGQLATRKGEEFIEYWKRNLRSKKHRKVLKGCMEIAIHVGPYGTNSALLGLNICNDIVQNAVTLLMMDNMGVTV